MAILETLKDVISEHPRLKGKSTTNSFQAAYFQLKSAFTNHPWGTMFVIVGAMVMLAFWGRGRMKRRGSGGFFRLVDSKEESIGGKVD